jgi:hypothetical protein
VKIYFCPICGSEYDPQDFPTPYEAEVSAPPHAFAIRHDLMQQCRGAGQPPRVEWRDQKPIWATKR